MEQIDSVKLLEECKEKGIKRPNSAYRWLRRNPTCTLDDYIAYRKSRPNHNNYLYCKENNLSYNTVRQWINRKEGRTAEDFVNRPPFLTQLCKDYDINYKNAEKWLWKHKNCKFEDYVKFLNDKAAKKSSKQNSFMPKESIWIRNHPDATKEEYIAYLKKYK